MTIIASDEGEILLLQYLLGVITPVTDKVMHLYTNDYTPSSSSVLSDFVEATDVDYEPFTMTMAGWTVGLDMTGTGAIGYYSDATFTFAAAADVYGYYVTDDVPNLLWAERFASPFSLPAWGGTITVQPRVELI